MAETTLVFGNTGSGKTTSLGEAVRYLYEKNGKPGRAIYADLGGWLPIQGLVDAGVVEVYNIANERNFPDLLHHVAQGYWPAKLEGGLRPQGVKLVAPGSAGNDLSKLGFYLNEGLTSEAETLMRFLREYIGPDKKPVNIGGDPVGRFTLKDDDGVERQFGANNLKHYDWVQGEMMVVLAELKSLPVPRVLLSAQETAGSDDDTHDPIRGPALVGKAGTSRIGKNVGDIIHYETYLKQTPQGSQMETKAFYRPHPDPKFNNVMYHCKTRIPLSQVGYIDKKYPGYFDPRRLGEFLEYCDSLLATDSKSTIAWRAEVDAKRSNA